MSSNFQKVVEFNKAFGVKTNTTIQHDIFDKDPKLVQYRLDLIEEEVDEFRQAIKENHHRAARLPTSGFRTGGGKALPKFRTGLGCLSQNSRADYRVLSAQ